MNTYLYANASPLNFIDPTGESALSGVLTGVGADAATPDPTDAAWPKWVAWGLAITGAAIYDMCSDSEADDTDECWEQYEQDMKTCKTLSKKFGKDWFRVCEQQAMERLGNCYADRDQKPDLPGWRPL